ncbi:quinoprotein dehydrogenase-associated SoxYZ-like carrier [soil metagenome]
MPYPNALASAVAIAVALALSPPAAAGDRPSPLVDGPTWEDLRLAVMGDATIRDGEGLYTLEAPFRAHDAATVPVRFVQEEGAPEVRRLTLVIDENPAPVAAEFTFGDAMQPLDLETRVRVDAYSNLRAIVETVDGDIYMTGRFVRASGGCSAPATKDAAAALAALGEMRVRWYDDAPAQSGVRRDAQVMLRHPNYSGLQRDQITHLFIPPHFVDEIAVHQGDALLFTMTGGISLSEDPAFRFAYTDTGGAGLTVQASDTDGGRFEGAFPLGM